jgi:hypothetical protein
VPVSAIEGVTSPGNSVLSSRHKALLRREMRRRKFQGKKSEFKAGFGIKK